VKNVERCSNRRPAEEGFVVSGVDIGINVERISDGYGQGRRHDRAPGYGVRLAAEVLQRLHVGQNARRIGEVLAPVPEGSHGVWPHESVRELLEELESEDMEDGVYFGRVNWRGITVRSPYVGGKLEVDLAERYRAAAEALAGFPRIARVFRRLAENYRSDARREDARRDLNEFS